MQRVVPLSSEQATRKDIEKRTIVTRWRSAGEPAHPPVRGDQQRHPSADHFSVVQLMRQLLRVLLARGQDRRGPLRVTDDVDRLGRPRGVVHPGDERPVEAEQAHLLGGAVDQVGHGVDSVEPIQRLLDLRHHNLPLLRARLLKPSLNTRQGQERLDDATARPR